MVEEFVCFVDERAAEGRRRCSWRTAGMAVEGSRERMAVEGNRERMAGEESRERPAEAVGRKLFL